MTEDFEAVLRGGSREVAARAGAPSAAVVRARGDELRRRRRTTTAALAVALVAAVGGGAFVVTGHSRQDPPPEAVLGPTTPAASMTPSPTAPSSTAPEPSGTTPDAPAATPASTPLSPCRSLTVPQDVKDAVTRAYRRSQPGLAHITPVKGTFYYGRCDGSFYAGAAFTPTGDATENELVQLQDEGGAEKYFTRAEGGAWTFVAGDGFPRDPRGCAAVQEIPAPLAVLWGDCLARP
ncbi:hypothetical protein [Streptomyces sp. NPDC005476]|uniref:hypothetical protein n=1 Tax=Streptomyces sp. NPDC005476 TaxID=3156882 RepID=UPI0034522087